VQFINEFFSIDSYCLRRYISLKWCASGEYVSYKNNLPICFTWSLFCFSFQ